MKKVRRAHVSSKLHDMQDLKLTLEIAKEALEPSFREKTDIMEVWIKEEIDWGMIHLLNGCQEIESVIPSFLPLGTHKWRDVRIYIKVDAKMSPGARLSKAAAIIAALIYTKIDTD